jgi:hypothetical protein
VDLVRPVGVKPFVTRPVRLALVCGLALIVGSRDADACSCALFPPCAAFSQADAVFVGVAEVVPTGKDSQRARLRIEEVFRGDLSKGSVIEIAGKGFGGSCDFAFADGSRYIVYARNLPDRGWNTTFCSRTKLVDEAAEDLEFVRRIASDPRGPGRVEGSAWIAERDPRGEVREVSPLAETSVSIRSDTHTFTVETDPRGAFTFDGVPAGRYTLSVRLSPQFEPLTPVTITVAGPATCLTHKITVLRRSRQK